MMLESGTLYRAAGLSAVLALIALVVAAVTIALFFGGAGQVFGPINDVFVAIMLIATRTKPRQLSPAQASQTSIPLRVFRRLSP